MPSKSKSLTTTKPRSRVTPLHPGEMLREEFMVPLGLSSNKLALDLRVPATRISEIVNERRGITVDTAFRLSRYFNMSPEFWMRIQAQYELEMLRDTVGARIAREIQPLRKAASARSLRTKAVA